MDLFLRRAVKKRMLDYMAIDYLFYPFSYDSGGELPVTSDDSKVW